MVSMALPVCGPIFIGAFTDPLPQGHPVSCTVLSEPGHYQLTDLADGRYYLFAAVLQASHSVVELLQVKAALRYGAQEPVFIERGNSQIAMDIVLTPSSWIDPPILIILPWLLKSCFSVINAQVVAGGV